MENDVHVDIEELSHSDVREVLKELLSHLNLDLLTDGQYFRLKERYDND